MDGKQEPKVEIADNSMSATFMLPEAFDRSTLTRELIASLVKSAGINLEALDQISSLDACFAMAKEPLPGPFEYTIAKAIPAIHGKDAYITWTLEDTNQSNSDTDDEQEHANKDQEDEDDKEMAEDKSVSFYDQSIFIVVKAGDVLGVVHDEIPGTEGRDVTGKPLPVRTAKPLEFKYDDSIGVNTNNQLIAKVDGVLMRDRKSARISDTIEVDQNVDFSTGNIDFPGNVLVRQGVKDCFTIKARDDIEVRGLIEAATLIAGNDLHVKGGFAGREQGIARVEGNLYAKYLDAVQTHIAGDLCVEREVINCNNTVLGNINCPRGALIGGETHVTGTVELLELGASAQPITELHVGALPLLDPLIASLTELVEQMIEDRSALLEEQEMITANSGAKIAPMHQAKLREITRDMGKLQLQLDRAEPSLERILERAESIRKIDIKIGRQLHPNALIILGGYRYRLTEDIKGPVQITANKRGQLEYTQGESKPQLLSAHCELRTAA